MNPSSRVRRAAHAPPEPAAHTPREGPMDLPAAGAAVTRAGGHENTFRRRFWICLLLSVPVWLYSPALQHGLGYSMPEIPLGDWLTSATRRWSDLIVPEFSTSAWLVPLFALLTFVYAGTAFWCLAGKELRRHRPGLMVLLTLACVAAIVYTLAVWAMNAAGGWLWTGVVLVDVLLLGLWTGMRSLRRLIGAPGETDGLLPDSVERITPAGKAEPVATGELHEGDLILVRLKRRPAPPRH